MSFPSTVQSITIAKTGDFDVIEKTEQPFPQQPAGYVIIKVGLLCSFKLKTES